MDAGIVVPVAFFVMIVAIVAVGSWSTTRTNMARLRLKEMMLERGMSAEEIERVLAAGETTLPPSTATRSAPKKPQPGPMEWPVGSHH